MNKNKLKQWEIALLLAIWLTMSLGSVPCYGWWGTIFPQLTNVYDDTAVETMAYAPFSVEQGGEKIEVRFRIVDKFMELKMRWS